MTGIAEVMTTAEAMTTVETTTAEAMTNIVKSMANQDSVSESR
jgi:hypothetical protein